MSHRNIANNMMPLFEEFGQHSLSSRDLYLLELSGPDALTNFRFGSQHFIALIIWDAVDISDATAAKFARKLLDSGCSYICTWGANSEWVHDIFDDQIVDRMSHITEPSTILTTWHTEDSLDEVLYYFLHATWPADDYFDSSRSSVVVTINADETHMIRVREILRSPEILDSLN